MRKHTILAWVAAVCLTAPAWAEELSAAALNRAAVGTTLTLPARLPAGWAHYVMPIGEKTPGYERWLNDDGGNPVGRVLLAFRPADAAAPNSTAVVTTPVVLKCREGNQLVIWLPRKLTGGGWKVSDEVPATELAPPVVEVASPDKAGEQLLTAWSAAEAGAILPLPATRPADWKTVTLRSTKVETWRRGQVVVISNDRERVKLIVAEDVRAEGSGSVADAWLPGDEIKRLPAGSRWSAMKTPAEKAAATAAAPLSGSLEGEGNQPLPLALPPTQPRLAEPPRTAAAEPAVTPPSPAAPAAGASKPWLAPGYDIQRGQVLDVAGLDPSDPPAGWNVWLVDRQTFPPGTVLGSPKGLLVVIAVRAKTNGESFLVGWYRVAAAGAASAEPLPLDPKDLSLAAAGLVYRLPGDVKEPPPGWQQWQFGPVDEVKKRRLTPGALVQFASADRAAAALLPAVFVDAAYLPDGKWQLRLWSAAKPPLGAKLQIIWPEQVNGVRR